MKQVRIYSGSDLSWIQDIDCGSNILAIEYCVDRNVIAISLADLNIVFFNGAIFAKKEETKITNNKKGPGNNPAVTVKKPTQILKKLYVPQTQKCLRYISRKTGGDLLFTASVSGNIFAFNLQDLFSQNFKKKTPGSKPSTNDFDIKDDEDE